MKRITAATFIAALLCLTASSASAQEAPPIPADQGQTEPGGSGGGAPGSTGDAGGIYQETQRTLVGGREVNSVPAGSTAALQLTLRNSTGRTISGATAALSQAVSPGRIVDGTAGLPDLAPNDTAVASFTIEVFEDRCESFFGAIGVVKAGSESWPIKVGFPVLCPGPQLSMYDIEFTGGDGDRSVEPGETLTIFVTLVNSGRDPATSVTSTLKIDGEIDILNGTSSWPDIASGGTARNLTPFVIKVRPDAKVQEECSGVTIEPMPAETVAVTPDGSVSSGTIEPETQASSGAARDLPASEPPADDPLLIGPPEEAQPGVAFAATFNVRASEASFPIEWSNQMVCALEGREPAMGGPAQDAGMKNERVLAASEEADAPDSGIPFTVVLFLATLAFAFRIVPRGKHVLG